MIEYRDCCDDLTPEQVEGFFVGWPNPPSPQTLLKILKGSTHIVLAIDDRSGYVIGFINAVSDGVLSAYIPLLEVLPGFQHRKIGTELVRRMIDKLKDFYMVDLICDDDLRPFYKRFGMEPFGGMVIRNFERQSGT